MTRSNHLVALSGPDAPAAPPRPPGDPVVVLAAFALGLAASYYTLARLLPRM